MERRTPDVVHLGMPALDIYATQWVVDWVLRNVPISISRQRLLGSEAERINQNPKRTQSPCVLPKAPGVDTASHLCSRYPSTP